MSADLATMFGAEPNTRFPEMPDAAKLLGVIWLRLGGHFSISSKGVRGLGSPLGPDVIPQLPHAEPWERFHTEEQWEGATKLVRTLIHRLSEEDTNYLFDLFADVAIDPRKLEGSVEGPTIWGRRQ
jgi:hypothetical protein